jgi:hypothetical protein
MEPTVQWFVRLLWLAPALFACGDASIGSSAPKPEESALFDGRALSAYPVEDRAYVMGHAFGVHLYSRALPSWIAATGYRYQPGKSSPEARVGYAYSSLVATSDCVFTDLDNYVCPEGEQTLPGDPGETSELPTGTEDDDDREADEPSDDPTFLDEDCESFLDPAAMQARALRGAYDVGALMGEGLTADEIEDHRADFDLGFNDSLALEDLDEETDFSEPYAMQDHAQAAGMCEHSPLVLDLDGDGVLASSPEDGVLFDLRETGLPLETAWPRGGDALLVLDRNGDGAITDGGELFGNALDEHGERYANGFVMLAELDAKRQGGNGDGLVDARDDRFDELRLWRDADRDGKSTPAELSTLEQAQVVSISLRHRSSSARDRHGNRFAQWGTFGSAGDKRAHSVVDVWFRARSAANDLRN